MLEEIKELERRAMSALRFGGKEVIELNGDVVVGLQASIGDLLISSGLEHRLKVTASGKTALVVNDSGRIILHRNSFESALLQLRKLQLLDDLADV